MSDKLLFMCRVCGVECDDHPVVENEIGEMIGQQAVCPDHCEEHNYQHDGWRNHYCTSCGGEPPDDWYYSEDDVGFGGEYLRSEPLPEPLGTPLSAMDGNATNRHNNPEGWDRWVAFCNANGHP